MTRHREGSRRSGTRSQRQLRVGEVLRHALSEILDRGLVRDPDLTDHPITVTEIRVSPDLRNATAYVMPLGGADCEAVVAALRRATPFLRRTLAGRVSLKFLPALSFEADTSFDQARHIDSLLRAAGSASAAPGDEDEAENDGT